MQRGEDGDTSWRLLCRAWTAATSSASWLTFAWLLPRSPLRKWRGAATTPSSTTRASRTVRWTNTYTSLPSTSPAYPRVCRIKAPPFTYAYIYVYIYTHPLPQYFWIFNWLVFLITERCHVLKNEMVFSKTSNSSSSRVTSQLAVLSCKKPPTSLKSSSETKSAKKPRRPQRALLRSRKSLQTSQEGRQRCTSQKKA